MTGGPLGRITRQVAGSLIACTELRPKSHVLSVVKLVFTSVAH